LPDIHELGFNERLGLLIDRELTARQDRRLQPRIRNAKLRHRACIVGIDDRHRSGLDKALMAQLASGN